MDNDPLEIITAEIADVLDKLSRPKMTDFAHRLNAAARVMVAGEGRSGLMARAFAMRLMHLGLNVHVVGETTTPSLAASDELVAVSGSGTTAATVRTAEQARALDTRICAITTDAQSRLGQLADFVLTVPAATKHRRSGEAHTNQPLSSLFDQATHLVFDAVCLVLADLRSVDNAQARRAHGTE